MTDDTTRRFVLRDLPLAARLVIATFLTSVGIGYFSALVQLHFQIAGSGKLLPDAQDATTVYHGRRGISQMERLLTADEHNPFNGAGTMVPAFTTKSAGWKNQIKKQAKDHNLVDKDGKPDRDRAEASLRQERNAERMAILHWIGAGAPTQPFEADAYPVPADLEQTITDSFAEKNDAEKRTGRVKIRSIFLARCERCHHENQGTSAEQIPLETLDQIQTYCQIQELGGGMSLKKLAQTTHVHLLGFSMLFGLTGLVFACTSFPGAFRLVVAPFTLIAQLVDISCWWLGRLDPGYAQLIVLTGSAVGASLFLQIILSLFNMFGKTGRFVLIVLIIAAGCGSFWLKEWVIDPYLLKESLGSISPD